MEADVLNARQAQHIEHLACKDGRRGGLQIGYAIDKITVKKSICQIISSTFLAYQNASRYFKNRVNTVYEHH